MTTNGRAGGENTLRVQIQNPDGAWINAGKIWCVNSDNFFRFDDDYFAIENRPLLGYSFEFKPRDKIFRSRAALPRWFSHLLPEGRLRVAVAEAAEISQAREFEMIRRLGESDLPGAVRVIDEESAETPRGHSEDEIDDELAGEDPVLKFSLAGAQMKFSVSEVDGALTLPVSGAPGDFILKLPDERPGFVFVPEAEHAAMRFAAQVGIDVAQTSLVPTSSIRNLGRWGESDLRSVLVARFDRVDGQRVHAEELAQVFDIAVSPPRVKYASANFESVASAALTMIDESAAYEVIRRIAFFALIGNGDAHLKNWGFSYRDGRTPSLSPAYDIVPTVAYLPDDDFGLNLGGSKNFSELSIERFDAMTTKVGLSSRSVLRVVGDVIELVNDGWPAFIAAFSGVRRQRLTSHLARVPLARGR